jgi:hypothetical protein
VRSFARLSGPGPLPSTRCRAQSTPSRPSCPPLSPRRTHAARCPAFAATLIQTSHSCRPVAPARDIPTRTLDARVLHTSSSVFDRPPDPASSTSPSAPTSSRRPCIYFTIYLWNIGHELRLFSAWAHYERARTDQTEHLENSSRPQRGRRADPKYVITYSIPPLMRFLGLLESSVVPCVASGERLSIFASTTEATTESRTLIIHHAYYPPRPNMHQI